MKSPLMVVKYIGATLLLVLSIAVVDLAGQTGTDATIDRLVGKYVRKHRNHGVAVAIVEYDSIAVKGYGHLARGQDYTPDAHTLFEIGSVTQVFTTTLMMLESNAGRFHISETINNFLPADIQAPSFRPFVCRVEYGEGLTSTTMDRSRVICEPDPLLAPIDVSFCDLASHTSGLPNHPRGLYTWNPLQWMGRHMKDPFHDFSRQQLYDNLYRVQITVPPGTSYRYSESGIALLGNLMADLSGRPFADLLHQSLLEPLGLSDTDFKLMPQQGIRMAKGHNAKGKATSHWHFDAMAPAAGLRSSAHDLALFVRANLSSTSEPLAEAFRQAHQPRIDVPGRRNRRETSGGYGWLVSILSAESNLPVVWVNGGTGGFRSFVSFNKDLGIGVIVLSNSANDVDELAFEIFEHLVERRKTQSRYAVR